MQADATPPITRNLSPADRAGLATHLLALSAADRRLRFGAFASDTALCGYVARIDFARDSAFGVIDSELRIVGAAHLARGPGFGELGLSVLPEWRRQGVGSALLARSTLHARGWFVRALVVHCLADNIPMIRLLHRRHAHVTIQSGEVEARVGLAPPDPGTVAADLLAEQFGRLDYAVKHHWLVARRLVQAMTPGDGCESRSRARSPDAPYQ